MEGYNGWKNYPTWCVKLWIDNDQGTQEYWMEAAVEAAELDGPVYVLERQLETYFQDEGFPEQLYGTMNSDLLTWALGQVDWREIAASLIEDAKELTT